MIRFLISLLIIAMSLTALGQQGAKGKFIQFENVSPELQEIILKKFPTVETEKPDLELLDQMLKVLHKESQYEIVQLVERDGDLILRIAPSDQIKNLVFTGLYDVSTSEAELLFGWAKGQTITETQLQDGVERLTGLYRAKGYLRTKITYKVDRDSKQKLQAIVIVDTDKLTMIEKVTIQSANDELNKILIKRLKTLRRKALSDDELRSMQEKISEELSERRYLQAQIKGPTINYSKEEDRAELIYQIDDPIQYAFDFKGNLHYTQQRLIKLMNLEDYITTNPNVGPDLTVRLKNAYIAQGFARVEIQDREAVTKANYKKLLFEIKEGPRIKIDKWNFTGKISQEQKEYQNLIIDSASEIIQDGYFVKEELDAAISNLKVALQNQGFLTAKIISTRYQYNRERDRVTVYVNLDEGPLTKIAAVIFEGNTSFAVPALREQIKMEEGKPLYLNLIDESLTRVRGFYQNQGYLEMAITNEKTDLVTYNEDNTQATVKFVIREGPQIKASSILYEGNSFTQDNVIRAELEFKEGDILTPAKIDDSILRLQRTGWFNSIEIRTLEENTAISQRTVIVRVTERNPGLFTVGAGATNERDLTLRGYTGIGYNNIFGTGRGVSLRLEGNYNVTDIKYLETRVTFGYLEPHIFATKNRGRINITRSKLVTDYNEKKITET
ncbi:MAG: POTRA domain-containing protein, partial [Bdellovibrionota bacterium]